MLCDPLKPAAGPSTSTRPRLWFHLVRDALKTPWFDNHDVRP